LAGCISTKGLFTHSVFQSYHLSNFYCIPCICRRLRPDEPTSRLEEVTQTGGYTEGDGDADNYTVLLAISVYLVSFYTIFYFWPYTVSHKAGKIQFGQAKLIRPKKSCVSPFRALKKCGSVGFFLFCFFPPNVEWRGRSKYRILLSSSIHGICLLNNTSNHKCESYVMSRSKKKYKGRGPLSFVLCLHLGPCSWAWYKSCFDV
jgi:hypothetical protein